MTEEKITCPKCGRDTIQQKDNRKMIEVGEKRQNLKLCAGCLIDMDYCICEDHV